MEPINVDKQKRDVSDLIKEVAARFGEPSERMQNVLCDTIGSLISGALKFSMCHVGDRNPQNGSVSYEKLVNDLEKGKYKNVTFHLNSPRLRKVRCLRLCTAIAKGQYETFNWTQTHLEKPINSWASLKSGKGMKTLEMHNLPKECMQVLIQAYPDATVVVTDSGMYKLLNELKVKKVHWMGRKRFTNKFVTCVEAEEITFFSLSVWGLKYQTGHFDCYGNMTCVNEEIALANGYSINTHVKTMRFRGIECAEVAKFLGSCQLFPNLHTVIFKTDAIAPLRKDLETTLNQRQDDLDCTKMKRALCSHVIQELEDKLHKTKMQLSIYTMQESVCLQKLDDAREELDMYDSSNDKLHSFKEKCPHVQIRSLEVW